MENKHKACETHCCILHGCKYGHKDCPVVLGEVKQQYLCETCDDDMIYGFSGKTYTKDEYKLLIDNTFIKYNRKIKINKILNKCSEQ